MSEKNEVKSTNTLEILKIDVKVSDGSTKIIEASLNITNETSTEKNYEIEIGKEDIATIEEYKLQEIASTADIKGFRPGKVPLNVVKSKFKESISREVLQTLIDKTISQLMQEKNLRPATEPRVEVKEFDDNKLKFKLSIELIPEVIIPDFSKITVEKPTFKVSDKEVLEAIETIAKANKVFEKADDKYKAQSGDALIIDYEGKMDGKLFDGGAAKGHKLVLGSKSFIDTFEEQLVGTKKGDEKNVKVKFPKEYHSSNLADKNAEFAVKVNEVQKAQEQKIDDDFAKKFGLKDLQDVKDKIKEQLENEYNKIAETKMRKELFDKLDKECNFDTPKSMVEGEFNALWKRAQEEKLQNPNMSDKNDDDLKKEYQEMAERRVKLGVLLAELGRVNKIEITQEDLQKAVIEQTRLYPGNEQQVFEFYQKNPKAIEQLKGPILEDKVVKDIFSKINSKDKNYTVEELKEFTKEL